MWLPNLLDFLNRGRSGPLVPKARCEKPRPRPAPYRLALEELEDRCVPAAMLSVWDVALLEGNSGSQQAEVTVTLSEPRNKTVTVKYHTADGTATAGSDYSAVSGKLTFAKNETSKTILVPVIGDRFIEPEETFFVKLRDAKGAKLANREAVVTIQDNEPRISIADAYNYGESSFTFIVSLAVVYDQEVTVHFATADGSAIAGVDYTATSGHLTFAPGQTSQTITVEVLDTTSAPDKWFSVQLSDASTNAVLVTASAQGYWYYDSGYYDYGYYDYGYYDYGYYDYGYYDYGYYC